MLMLLKNTRKRGIKDVAALDLRAAKQPWVMSVFGGEAADRKGKAGTRDDRQGTGLSETDHSPQRANIKLGKYHYQQLNKVAAVRH